MRLVSMQQAEATRVEPVFAAVAHKFRSFLLSIRATLQTTPNDMKLQIDLNAFTFTSFTHVLHIYMKQVRVG